MSAPKPLIFRNRSFGLLWVGQIFSQAGTRIYQIATLWWLLAQNPAHAGRTMGFFMLLCALPAVFLIKIIGHVIDQNPAKKVLVSSDILALLVTVTLAISLHFQGAALFAVYATGFLLSIFQAFIDPTLNKAIPQLTETADVEAGVAFVTSTQPIANFGGAVLGAFIISQLSLQGAVLLNALSFAISTLANLAIRFKVSNSAHAEKGLAPKDADDTRGHLPPALSSGATPLPISADGGEKNVGLFEGRPFLRSILIIFGLINFFSTALFIMMPVYTKVVFHRGASWLAAFEASLWLGFVTGTFSSGLVRGTKNVVRLGGALLALCGFSLALPAILTSIYLYPIFLFVAAWAVGLNNVKIVTLFQNIVEDSKKGRFFAAVGAISGFMFPASYLVFGLLIDRISLTTLSLIQGGGVMALAAWLYAKSGSSVVEGLRPTPNGLRVQA